MGGVRLAWGVASDVGLTRRVNEDAVLAEPPLFLVADGMGGHDAGDVASALVIEHFQELLRGAPLSVRSITDSIERVNDEIVRRGIESGTALAMGTTVVGAALVDNGGVPSWLVFNIGDSRIYRRFGAAMQQISVDHSYVQELVDSGVIDAQAARSHPQRNVVTRALGMDSGADVDVWFFDPEPGERLIICSDGLSSEVDDAAIDAVADGLDPSSAADSLVRAALAAGGRDNVSVLVVDVLSVDPPDVTESDTAPRHTTATGEAAMPPADLADQVPPAGLALISVPSEMVPGDAGIDSDVGSSDAASPVSRPMIDGVPSELTPQRARRPDHAGPSAVDDVERNDE